MHNDITYFPCESWNDFVVILAAWWLDVASQLRSQNRKTRMQFMDGPYWIDAERKGDRVYLECIDDHSPRTCKAKFDCDIARFQSEISRFARSVWKSCKGKNIKSDDIRILGGKLGLSCDDA